MSALSKKELAAISEKFSPQQAEIYVGKKAQLKALEYLRTNPESKEEQEGKDYFEQVFSAFFNFIFVGRDEEEAFKRMMEEDPDFINNAKAALAKGQLDGQIRALYGSLDEMTNHPGERTDASSELAEHNDADLALFEEQMSNLTKGKRKSFADDVLKSKKASTASNFRG